MELPSRAKGQILLAPGEMVNLRSRLRAMAPRHDLTTVIACAFDHRTRILPFIYADLRMPPAGVRAIGSALVDAGFSKTRIVLQQWNRNFSPSQMRLDGRIPDLFLVSSMHLHGEECDRLIREAQQIEPARRPLIIAGGPRIIYEPWLVFGDDQQNPWGADVAVTGEEFVFLSLLEVLLSLRATGESMRSVFLRAKESGALDEIPGLVYARSATAEGPAEELVDTGIQRLLGDLDELPHPVLGYQLLEAPSRAATLATHALPARRVRKHSLVSSIVLTVGCKFRCSYCPIPAYNQRQHRMKSGERIADEMGQIVTTYGISNFFGTDDNFFNDTKRTLEIAETLARKASTGQRPYCKIMYGTEATVHDTIRLREHLPLIRRSGLAAVWMGVEDLTGTLVKKGQNQDKTIEAFQLLRGSGIAPIPMMMHHDTQPLVTWKNNYGLLNQLRTLAEGRGAVHAGADAHTVGGVQVVRRHVHVGDGVRLRERRADCAAYRRWQLRGGLEASTPVDQAAQLAGCVRLFFQPAANAARHVLVAVATSLRRRRNSASRRNREILSLAETGANNLPQGAGSLARCWGAGAGHVRLVSHLPPHAGVGLESVAGRHPAQHARTCQSPRHARSRRRSRQSRSARHAAGQRLTRSRPFVAHRR